MSPQQVTDRWGRLWGLFFWQKMLEILRLWNSDLVIPIARHRAAELAKHSQFESGRRDGTVRAVVQQVWKGFCTCVPQEANKMTGCLHTYVVFRIPASTSMVLIAVEIEAKQRPTIIRRRTETSQKTLAERMGQVQRLVSRPAVLWYGSAAPSNPAQVSGHNLHVGAPKANIS